MSLLKLHQPGFPCCCSKKLRCFVGKCYKITFSNDYESEDPQCWKDIDGLTVYMTPLLIACGAYNYLTISDVGVCGFVQVGAAVNFSDCLGQDTMWVSIYAGDYPQRGFAGLSPQGIQVGEEGYQQAVKDAIRTLCGGGQVNMEWVDPLYPTGLPDLSGVSATLELVDAGEDTCEGWSWPPNEPPEYDCADLDACDSVGELMSGFVYEFQDCTIPPDGGAHDYLEERFYSELNQVFLFRRADTIEGVIFCVAATKYNFLHWIVDINGKSDEELLPDPGILLIRNTKEEEYQDLIYACGISIATECMSGDYPENRRWFVTEFHVLLHGWRFAWDGAAYSIKQLYFTPACDSYYDDYLSVGAIPFNCNMVSSALSGFDYDLCGDDEVFYVRFLNALVPV